jgi:hypothetical protein
VVRSAGGGRWQKLAGGLPDTFGRLPLLASYLAEPGHVYLASSHGQVWHSDDHGDNWQPLPLNMGNIWFRLLAS